MVSLLTFRLQDSLFALPVDIVKWIVSIDRIYPIAMMSDYVIGEIRYGEHINFLVCFEQILELGRCQDHKDKSAIIVSIKEKEFALMVDEILYIKEIENYEYAHDKVSFLSEGDKVVEVFKPDFFDRLIDIPAIRADYEKEKRKLLSAQNIITEEVRDLLLFDLGESRFAIDSQLVQFVEVVEDSIKGAYTPKKDGLLGIFLVKKRLLKLLGLKALLKLPDQSIGSNILVLKKNNRYLGLNVDEIHNIESIDPTLIHKSDEDGLIKEFFIKDGTIVSILDSQRLQELTLKEGIEDISQTEERRLKSIVDMKEFLIILVGSSKYAIPMENVKEIHEQKDVHITRSLEHAKEIEGIATVGAKSFLVIDLLGLLGEKRAKESMLLVLEEQHGEKNFEFAIFINEVEDIIHVAKEELYSLTKQDRFLLGTIMQENELYNIVNIHWLIDYLKERH